LPSPAPLAAFCQRQRGVEFVANRYRIHARQDLLAAALPGADRRNPREAAAIDNPWPPGLDLEPLLALMADPKVLKVFHAARQDVEIFFHMTGSIPGPAGGYPSRRHGLRLRRCGQL